jgi:hypothetical protein
MTRIPALAESWMRDGCIATLQRWFSWDITPASK